MLLIHQKANASVSVSMKIWCSVGYCVHPNLRRLPAIAVNQSMCCDVRACAHVQGREDKILRALRSYIADEYRDKRGAVVDTSAWPIRCDKTKTSCQRSFPWSRHTFPFYCTCLALK